MRTADEKEGKKLTQYTVFDRQIIMTDDALKEEVIQDLDRLSGESHREVRDFIQFLQRKSSSASAFDTIDARRDAVPEGEWEAVPTDASTRLDEHLYQSGVS